MNIFYLLRPVSDVALLHNTTCVSDALAAFSEFRFSAVPVITDDGKYFGTVTATDFLNFVLTDGSKCDTEVGNILDIAKNPPVHITAKLDDLLHMVMEQNFVPVIDDRECFMGIVTRRRIMEYYYERYERLKTLAEHED
jgi:CBS domain-containing protein